MTCGSISADTSATPSEIDRSVAGVCQGIYSINVISVIGENPEIHPARTPYKYVPSDVGLEGPRESHCVFLSVRTLLRMGRYVQGGPVLPGLQRVTDQL